MRIFLPDREAAEEDVDRMDEVVALLVDERRGRGLVIAQHVHEIDEGVALAGQRDAVAVEKGAVDGKGVLLRLVLKEAAHRLGDVGLVAVAVVAVLAQLERGEESFGKLR